MKEGRKEGKMRSRKEGMNRKKGRKEERKEGKEGKEHRNMKEGGKA